MYSLERRLQRVELKVNATANDLALLSGDELSRRATALAAGMLVNRAEVLDSLRASPVDDLSRLLVRLDAVAVNHRDARAVADLCAVAWRR